MSQTSGLVDDEDAIHEMLIVWQLANFGGATVPPPRTVFRPFGARSISPANPRLAPRAAISLLHGWNFAASGVQLFVRRVVVCTLALEICVYFPLKTTSPSYSTPYVTWFLIALNLLIYLFQFYLQVTLEPRSYELFVQEFGEVPVHLAAFLGGSHKYSLPQVAVPFFTSMFLHGSWMHVIGNMWFL